MKAKKLMSLALTGAMVLSLSACGGSSDSSSSDDSSSSSSEETTTLAEVLQPNTDEANTEESDETLTVALSSEPSCLYGAAVGTTENEEQIIGNTFLDRLVKVDYSTNEVEPSLATDWEWVDDTHLKFTLRDDVTMTDGTPLVADDVVYSATVWVENNATNDTGKYIVGATAEDEHTVTIEFTTTAPDFLTMMSWTNFGIISEDEVNAAGGLEAVSTNPVVGCGPYVFKEWVNGQHVVVERNEDYWDDDYVAYYQEIEFIFISDAAAREMAIESGDADVTIDIPVSQAATYAAGDAVNISIYEYGQSTHLWYNMGENAGVTSDILVRQAIDKALDFDAIAQVGTAGYGESCLSYFDPTCSYYSAYYTEEDRAVDIEGAKELLAEAGYEDGLELTMLGLSDIEPVMTVIQANLAEAGITLTIDMPDTAQFVESAFGGDYDIIAVGDTPAVRTPASVMPFLQTLNVSGSGMVIGGPKWTTDEFDSTIASLISESDNDAATELAATLDGMIDEQMVCSNLYTEMKAAAFSTDLKGFTTMERGFIDVTELYK